MELYYLTGIVLAFFTAITGLMIWLFRIANNRLYDSIKEYGNNIKLLELQNQAQNEALQSQFKNGYANEYKTSLENLMKEYNFKQGV